MNSSHSSLSQNFNLQHILSSRGTLVIACLNVNSLVAHIDQLRIFLSSHKIDILAFNETKLDPSVTSNDIHIAGYDVVRRDRPYNGRHGAGVCIFIKNNLNYSSRNDLDNTNLELLAIEICKPRSRPFLVVSWNRPPDFLARSFNDVQDVIGKIDAKIANFIFLAISTVMSRQRTPIAAP